MDWSTFPAICKGRLGSLKRKCLQISPDLVTNLLIWSLTVLFLTKFDPLEEEVLIAAVVVTDLELLEITIPDLTH